MMSRRAIAATSALTGLPCGFAAKFCAEPSNVLTLSLVGDANQNPDPSGRPSLLAIRVFLLAATGRFETADVFALTEREAQTLGHDSPGAEEIVLAPKEIRTITRELKPEVKFLGTVALFREIDHAQWRATSSLAARASKRTLKIGRLSAQPAGS